MPHFFYRLFAVFMAVIMPTTAFAAVDSGDTAWILTATALVLFMTLPGLALFYAGLVQSKNVVSVLMHHFAVACLISVLWVVAGYSLAFSGDGAWVGDLSKLFMGEDFLEVKKKAKSIFKNVSFFKPVSSRSESKETYIHCKILKTL